MPNSLSGAGAAAEGGERSPLAEREIAIGKQYVRIEPEIVYVRLRDSYEAHEVRSLTALLEQINAEQGVLYILGDIRELRWFASDARHDSADWMRRTHIGAMAVVGAGQHIRAIVSLVLRAAILLGGARYPLRFIQTEEEARAWLIAERSAARLM